MRTMWDRAFPPAASPGPAFAFGFYLPSTATPHPWARDEIAAWAARVPAALPIYVMEPGRAAVDAAAGVVTNVRSLGLRAGDAVAVDVEHYAAHPISRAWVGAWAPVIARAGFRPLTYCSLTDANLFADLTAMFVAHWTNVPHLEPGTVATQYRSPTSDPTTMVDWSVLADGLQLWQPHGAPAPPASSSAGDSTMAVWVSHNGTAHVVSADLRTVIRLSNKATAANLIASLPHTDVDDATMLALTTAPGTRVIDA